MATKETWLQWAEEWEAYAKKVKEYAKKLKKYAKGLSGNEPSTQSGPGFDRPGDPPHNP